MNPMQRGPLARSLARPWGPMPAGYWLLLLGASALLYLYRLGGFQALTEHEIVVAGIAKQMLRDGTWGGLWIGDYAWLEKPPLPHWLAALSLLAVGNIGEAAVRLPSALEGAGVVLIVAWLAARWFTAELGLLSGLVQASAYYAVVYARLAENDMVLCVLVAATIACFVEATRDGNAQRRWWRLGFWILLGATNLSKGPMFGAGIVGIACAAWMAWRLDWTPIARLWSPVGIVLFALVAAAWPAWVFAQGQGPLLLEWWGAEMSGRVDGTYFQVAQPWWYYIGALAWQMLPWTPAVAIGAVPSLRLAWRDRDSGYRFCWCWAAAPILLLSIPPHKHHHYIIHALPGLAPIAALGVAEAGRWFLGLSDRAQRGGGLALVVGGLATAAVAAALSAIPLPGPLADYAVDLRVLGIVLGIGLVAQGWAWRRQSTGLMAAAGIGTILALYTVLQSPLLPDRDLSRFDRAFLRSVDASLPAGARLIVTGRQPAARHLFYLDRPGRPAEAVWRPEDVRRLLRPGERAYVVTRAEDEPALAAFAAVEVVAASARTRSERAPSDRYTLFRLTAR